MGTNYIAPIWRMPRNANKDKLSNYSIDFRSGNSARYINCGTDLFTGSTIPSISISVWIKTTIGLNGNAIISKDLSSTGNRNFLLQFSNNDLYWQTSVDGNTLQFINTSVNLLDGEWHHIVATYEAGATSGTAEKKIYVDGQVEATDPAATLNNIVNTPSVPIEIARRGDGVRYFSDNMSQVCIFDYALSTDQINYLYNLNNPMAITGAEPVAYWPLGDNSNPNANAGYPNISVGADSVFDFVSSSSQYIDCGDNDAFSFGNSTTDEAFSVSAWIKMTDATRFRILSKYVNANREYIFTTSGSDLLSFALYDNSTGGRIQRKYNTALTSFEGQWIHVVGTYDGSSSSSGISIYLNGAKVDDADGNLSPYEAMENTAQPFLIGSQDGSYANGEISNTQIWSTELSASEVTTLYNNGQPLMTGTQPQEANLQAWYKLNQSANYDQGISGNPFRVSIFQGAPDYTSSGDGAYNTGGKFRWEDNGTTSTVPPFPTDTFAVEFPTIYGRYSNIVPSSSGGSFNVGSGQYPAIKFQYNVDGAGWVDFNEFIASAGGSGTWTFTSPAAVNCESSYRLRAIGYGGSDTGGFIDLNQIVIASNGVSLVNEEFNQSTQYGAFGGNISTPPVETYIDPSWQIPDNRSAYPQSFDFTKTPQEYIDLGKDDWFNEYNNEITFSVWVNKKNWSSTGFESIISKYGLSGATLQYRIAYPSSAGKLQFYLQGSATSGSGYSARIKTVTLTSAQQDSEWLHVIWRHDASTNRSEAIFNGDYTNAISLSSTNANQDIAGNPYAQPQITTTNMIGNVSNGLQPFDGAISNYQRFNSYLDNATVQALYNDGIPSTTAIAPTNSQAWYKLDNTEIWENVAEQWRIKNNVITNVYYNRAGQSSFGFLSGYFNYVTTTNLTQSRTISLWIKYDINRQHPTPRAGFFNNPSLVFWSTGFREVNQASSGLVGFTATGVNLSDGGWHHILLHTRGDSTATDNIAYIDGKLANRSVVGTNSFTFGNPGVGYSNRSGNLPPAGYSFSNVVMYNGDATSNVDTLYNNGTPPEDVSSTNPDVWWKVNSTDNSVTTLEDFSGNNNDGVSTYTGPVNMVTDEWIAESATSSELTEQSLVNNNVSALNGESEGMNSTNLVTSNISRTQPYSNYSFNFDRGQADFFDLGTDSSMDVFSSDFSCSVWFNHTDASGGANGILEFSTFTQKFGMQLGFTTNTGVSFSFGPNLSQSWSYNGGSGYNDGNWHNFIVTKNGSSLKGYVDGVELTFSTGSITLGGFNAIGKGRNTPTYFNGKLSNCCLFDRSLTEQEILKIYNNGLTQDLQTTSSFSNNIAAWWPMDQRSSYYDGTDWVIRDLENGNDGDGNNTGNVDDLVGNAPGSEASGSGNNLAIADLKGNMYNSDKNAYSINMADYADGVTNPANSGRSTDTP